MPKRDPRVDQHIQSASQFAKPILKHLRKLIHEACPKIEEDIKWGMPHFLYRGKILCGMAGFKSHCALFFWKGALVVDKSVKKTEKGMGNFGRIKSLKDLPSDATLRGYVKKAVKLYVSEASDDGVKSSAAKRLAKSPKPQAKVPAELMKALRANKRALAVFKDFSPSKQKEYATWIAGAKTEETRERRLETAVEWIAEGKARNWKYMKK